MASDFDEIDVTPYEAEEGAPDPVLKGDTNTSATDLVHETLDTLSKGNGDLQHEPSFDVLHHETAYDILISDSVEVTTTTPKTSNPAVAQFVDHFTLSVPSSTIRYRDSKSAARVVQARDSQFILEETYNPQYFAHKVEIRQIADITSGVRFLRILYVIVTAFWTGFLFIFCLHILLFLALNLSITLGLTNKTQDVSIGKAVGAILGILPLIYSLASALVLAGAFIMDTWHGHPLMRNFAFRNFNSVMVEWIFFIFFLGLPLFIMCWFLLFDDVDWWEVTALVWFSSVGFFYALFAINVMIYEVYACWLVTKNRYHYDDDSWFGLLTRSILYRQMHTYSGTKRVSFLSKGTIEDIEYTDKGSNRQNRIEESVEIRKSMYTKCTLWAKLNTEQGIGLFRNLSEAEERFYTIDDARDVRPFVTKHNWELEKVFCRPQNSRYIAIVKGPGALTVQQLRSSMACSAIGTLLMFFIVISILVYMGGGLAGTLLGVVMAVIYIFPVVRSTFKLYTTTVALVKLAENGDKEKVDAEQGLPNDDLQQSEGVYYGEEIYRITKPTRWACWVMFFLEFVLFFFYPLYGMFATKNWPLGLMYLIFVGTTGIRYYVNAGIVLEETGHMDLVGGTTDYSKWKKQSRLNEIVGNITNARSLWGWVSVLGFTGFAFIALMVIAVGTGSAQGSGTTSQPSQNTTQATQASYVNDFEYLQVDALRYPTCQLSNDLGESPLTRMADYAFLAGLAYVDVNDTQQQLDAWFNGSAHDQNEVVENFRVKDNTTSAVSYKLVTFPKTLPDNRSFAYMLIRGTQNAWDMLTDAQLWSAAAMMQMHREILPAGAIWTPIMKQLIRVITLIESESIDQVSFYKDTGRFVDFLLQQTGNASDSLYSGVAVTGHSLGGGLSIITGAQKGVPAVALSGPNAMLSRKSFDPPIHAEALDNKTFNIIPERDLVPMIDDKAQNYQYIRCLTKPQDVLGCHDSTRSLCEIIYTCGSMHRPIPCLCVNTYGYPEPLPKAGTNRTFSEACPKGQG